ncbi:MAG TPA: hypothetical protein VLU24_07960, partial [Mycobacterium sp.]|nr:hypothetical protein [Mycobacterium sp.]
EMELSITHTSDRTSSSLNTYGARTCTLKLLNMDGALDPYVLEGLGLTAPGVIMRLLKIWNGISYPIFYGFVDAWNPDAETPELGTVTVTATDGFKLLNQPLDELVSPIGSGDAVSVRVDGILTAMNWPTGLRALGATDSNLQATSYGAAGLELIQEAVKAEVGEFYQQPDGYMFLRGRHAIVTDARSNTSQATFGSNRAGGEIPYVGRPVSAWDMQTMHNRVKAQIDGSSNTMVAQDSTSIGLYGTQYTIEETSLKLRFDSEAQSWANYVLAQDVKPRFRFSGITLSSFVEQLGISVMPHMLGRRFGDRITVVRRPPAQPYGSIVDSRQLLIRGVNHTWSRKGKQWLTTWDLEPVNATPFFVIGSATQGVIGSNALAW